MGSFFTKGTAATRIQQVTYHQNQPALTTEQIIEQRNKKKNEILRQLIENELLPNINTTDKLSMICNYWIRRHSSVQQEFTDDVIQIIIQHSQFNVLEYKLIHKIIENGDIQSAFQWFFEETNMKIDQQLIVEILASNRKYINPEYITKYLNNSAIDEIFIINYLKLCGINESLGGIEQCFRYFFGDECGLYIPSMHIHEYQLITSAFTKLMLLNNNIKNEVHRKYFENDPLFVSSIIHAMFWSTGGSKHWREISRNPSNPQMAAHAEKHGVMADILEMFEKEQLKMQHAMEEISPINMVQITP